MPVKIKSLYIEHFELIYLVKSVLCNKRTDRLLHRYTQEKRRSSLSAQEGEACNENKEQEEPDTK